MLLNSFVLFYATGIWFQKIQADIFKQHLFSNFSLKFEM